MSERASVLVVVGALVALLLVARPDIPEAIMNVVVPSRADFLRTVKGAVLDFLAERQYRAAAGLAMPQEIAAIVAAQAALETGYGKTIAWREGFNFGNITAGSVWSGDVIAGGDTEYDAAGNVKPITQAFRKYASVGLAVQDFFSFLNMSRYRTARDRLYAGDAEGYATKLREGGYYTAPLAHYVSGINAALPGAREVQA